MDDFIRLRNKANDLKKWADLDGTEVGQFCDALVTVVSYPDYIIDDGFRVALEKEIDKQLQNFKDNFTIETWEETYIRKITDLVPIDDR